MARKATELERFVDRLPVLSWFSGEPLFSMPDLWERLGRSELKVEEYETETEHVVRAELAGVDPDKDIDVTVDGGMLRIKAERRQESKEESKGTVRSEFTYGSFSRTLPLPPGATEADVKATYEDGILEVRVPIDHGKAKGAKVPVTKR